MNPAQPTASGDIKEREARVRENVALIRERLDEIVTREARALGWSMGDAKMIVQSATLEYFSALSRHEPPDEALRTAIEESDRKHVVQYLTLVAKEGKVSMRHALQDVLVRRLDTKQPQERAAMEAAMRKFDETILRAHSVDGAVTASREAALSALQATPS